MTTSAAIEGWFTTGPDPALLGSRCTTCGTVFFPKKDGFCAQPRVRGRGVRRGRAVAPGHHLVLHRRAVPAAAAVHLEDRPLRAVRARRGRAAGGSGRARARSPTGTAWPTSRSAPRPSWSSRRSTPTRPATARSGAGSPSPLGRSPRWARSPTSEQPRRRRRRGRHAPLGQVGQELRRRTASHAARAALADSGIAWQDVDFIVGGETVRNGYGGYVAGATFAQALGWNGAKVATSYAACATGAQALDTARARILAGCQRGRARRRCRHHAEGLPRAQRRRALRRPGLAAVPAARHDQPGLLRALRAPPDGPLRRDPRGLRGREGQERQARPGEPQRALPQGGQRRGRADQRRGLRPAAPARHLRDLRRRRRGGPLLDGVRRRSTASVAA